jgi:translocation and assembly module TamB
LSASGGSGRRSARTRRRRWARRLVLALASLVGVAVVLVLGAVALVATPPGGDRLRKLVVERANATIQGTIAAGRLSLRGGHLVLERVELRDPGGEVVASADRVEVRLRLLPLVRKRVDLALVRVERPELRLRQDEGGTNLERAIAPRNPAPDQQQSQGSGVALVVEALEIDRGVVDLVQRSPGSSRHVRVEDVVARGSARAAGDALEARLAVRGAFRAPFEGPLDASVDATGAGARKDARVSVALGDATLAAVAHLDDEAHGSVRIESLAIPPEIARAFAPGYPLRVPVSASGEGRRDGDAVSLRLDANAGSARLRIDGDWALAARRTRATTVAIRHVDLAELAGGPPSDVELTLVAEGGGTSLADLDGRVELRAPPSKMGRETMGPVHVLATAANGEVQLADARIHVPGVRLEAGGRGSKERLAVSGTLVADDLAALGRSLGALAGVKVASLRGRGQLAFSAAGTPAHPSLLLHGAFPFLASDASRVEGLAVQVGAPDLRDPTSANAHLAARTVALASGKAFRAVRLDLERRARELALGGEVHGDAELVFQARATVAPGGRAGTLDALQLRYPEARWSLASPVRFEAREGSIAVSPLTLRSGAQSISARLEKRGGRVDASLALRSLDLATLPRAFVDPSLRLGGVLDVEARVRGRASSPDVVAKVALRDGSFGRFRALQLHLDASYANDEARGTVQARGEGVSLDGTFAIPMKALRRGRPRAPVKVELDVPELRFDESLRDLGVDLPLSGLASAQVSIRGTADDPRLVAAVKGRRIAFRQVPPSDVELALSSGADGRLRARLELAVGGRKSSAELRTAFTLGELLRNPPDRETLLARPFALDADVRELPLQLLSQAGVASGPLGGALSVRARLAGTPAAPRGELSATGSKLTTRRLEPVDARVRVQVGDELSADVSADQRGRSLLAARVRVAAAPERLLEPGRFANAPLSIQADVGPLSLAEMQDAFEPEDVDPARVPPRVRGVLTGRLTASGSLRDPRAGLRARVEGLGADRSPDGTVELAFDYASARETLELVLASQGGGELRAHVATGVDLSYPAVTRRQALDGVPLEATVRAGRFDPGFLASLTGAVEKLGGAISADARVAGTLGTPTASGTIEWKDGFVFTHGNGDFTAIRLRARGDDDRIEIEELSAKSGRGTAKLAALATRNQRGAFELHATADLDKLPIVTDGQVSATISLRSTADGNVSPSRVVIRNLSIPEAHVQLPEVQRKNVQKLGEPPDVVLTMGGKPVRGTKRQADATATLGAAAGGTGSVAGPAGEPGGGPRVVVRVNAPRNLWIQGNDVNTEFGLSEGFRVEVAGTPRVFGTLNVIRGRLEVFGRRFDFQRDSKVSFSGSPALPALDVTSIYKNELEAVTVTLKVQGEPDKLELKPTSDPPLSETEIYTLLATGHTSLRHGSGASSPSGEAASLIGSVAASQLKKTLSGKLPLDVFSIEAGDNGLGGTKLEAGTYVNDRFYIGFTGRIGADPMHGENSNQVDLEYQLTRRWSVNGSYGDARAGGAGIIWRKDY